VTRCHICERPLEHDRDPYYVQTHPGHYDDERFEVATANHRFVTACWSCWMKWPDDHKRRCGEVTIPEREQYAELFAETVP